MTNLVDTAPRSLGQNFQIGPLGYGCWRLVAMSVSDAQARIECALDHGMNLIDTADVYGLDWGGTAFGASEVLLGDVLKAAPTLRDQMVLASKGGIIPGVPYDSAYLQTACEDSLRRLGVDQLDLYQIHRPDMLTHPEETAKVLENLLSAGKVREIGVSNYQPSQTDALAHFLSANIVSQQPEFSLLHLDPMFDGTFDQCMKRKQTVLAWSPLGGGKLGGDDLSAELLTALDDIASREGVDRAAVAMAFVLAHPAKPVALVGSINLERIAAATDALNVTLNRADAYRLMQAAMGESLP